MTAPSGHPNLTRAGQGHPGVPDDQRRVPLSITLPPDLVGGIDADARPDERRKGGKVNRSKVIARNLSAALGRNQMDNKLKKLAQELAKSMGRDVDSLVEHLIENAAAISYNRRVQEAWHEYTEPPDHE